MIIKEENYFIILFLEFYNKMQLLLKDKKIPLNQIQQDLSDIMEKQAMTVSINAGAFIYDCYRELQYMLCAMTDEMILFSDRDDKQWWKEHLLERKFFNTHIAGEQIFKNIDHFLQRQDNYKKSLFVTYLYLLSLGFKGKFNMNKDSEKYIKKYKEDLFFSVYNYKSENFTNETLFKNALTHNMIGDIMLENKKTHLWLKYLTIIAFCYISFMHIIWFYNTRNIYNSSHKIYKTIQKIKQ